MQIHGKTALVSGANRGLGAEFTRQLVARGATVYAGARTPGGATPGVVPLTLDITDPGSVAAAAAVADDVDILVNNAGLARFTRLVDGDLGAIREEMDTNMFGTLEVVRAFAPVLTARGGGAVLNVLSVLSWASYPGAAGYAASKAALWSLTDALRHELPATQVLGLVLASTDTDMMAGFDVPKNDPADVVRAALDGLERGELEVLADEPSRAVKASLSLPPSAGSI